MKPMWKDGLSKLNKTNSIEIDVYLVNEEGEVTIEDYFICVFYDPYNNKGWVVNLEQDDCSLKSIICHSKKLAIAIARCAKNLDGFNYYLNK